MRVDYRQLADVRLPPARVSRKRKARNDLYPVDILERTDRVHYIGYSSSHDEWKDISN